MKDSRKNGNKILNRIPDLDPGLDFLRLLWSVDHSLHRMSKRMSSSLGITGTQRLVIRIVGRFPGISAGQLAQILQVHPSTLTGVLRRLHNRRAITRHRDPRDKRRAVLGLTAKGRLYDANREETIEAAVRQVLSLAPTSALIATREVLQSIVDALQERSSR
jgi:DNA-binding MarR family transcriptional regulator